MSDGSARPPRFHVAVIGAGIGGLTLGILLAQAGHQVTAIERKPSYDSLSTGGGIHVTGNGVLIFQSMGIGERLEQVGDRVRQVQVRRYANSEIISTRENVRPAMMFLRHDLLLTLYNRAIELGVEVKFERRISKIQADRTPASVSFDDGTSMTADIVVGADGVNSKVREDFLPPSAAGVSPTADCVFFVDVPGSIMRQSPHTQFLCDIPPYHVWLGPGRSIVSWYLTRHDLYHLQVCDYEYGHVGDYGGSAADASGYVSEVKEMSGVRARWSDFDAPIRTILAATESCLKWQIVTAAPLPSWSAHAGRLLLLGDAAHVFPPFAGQGAAMAIEDAACLATLMGYARGLDDMRAVAAVYESVRRPRVEKMHQVVLSNIVIFGLPDGDQQRERDRSLRDTARSQQQQQQQLQTETPPRQSTEKRIGNWNTPQRVQAIEDYDAVEEARKAWQTYQAKL